VVYKTKTVTDIDNNKTAITIRLNEKKNGRKEQWQHDNIEKCAMFIDDDGLGEWVKDRRKALWLLRGTKSVPI